MNRFAPLLLCSLTLACTSTFAAPGFVDLIGAASTSMVRASNRSIAVTSNETDTLKQTNNDLRDWNSLGVQFGIGYVFLLSNPERFSNRTHWLPMVEPQLNVYFNDYENKGTVNRFGSPNFSELNYKERIRSTRLMLDLAVALFSVQQFSPYIKVGVGNAWNDTSYSDHANSSTNCGIQGLNLNGRNTSHFAWEAGVGFMYAFNEVAMLSFEYLYTNFGRIQSFNSAKIPNTVGPVTSSSNTINFSAQALLLGIHMGVL